MDLVNKILAYAQSALSIDGGTWVDIFAVVFIIRLLAPLKGFAPMTNSEAGIWATTIMSFSYNNTNRPKGA